MSNINEIIIPNIPNLSFSVNSLNFDKHTNTLRGRHFHKEFEIFRVDEGVMQVCTDDTISDITAGDIVLINSLYVHEIKPVSSRGRATYFQIDLQPYINSFFNNDDTFLYNFLHIQQSEKIRIFSSDKICDIINQIEFELINKQDYYDIQIRAYIFQLIVYLFRYNFIINDSRIEKKSIEKILPVLNYINQNIDKKIPLSALCDVIHIDKYYFCKLFKQTMGTTLTEYVNFARLYKAKQLILNDKTSISEIAFECGFSSTQYFNKLFKKQHGVSPTQYKKLFFNVKD